jgi:hypothetical protein
MARVESGLSPRARSAQREASLLMLWALFQAGMKLTEADLRQGLADAQWRRFESSVNDLPTDSKPVSENALREYLRLLKIADKLSTKLHPKRAKPRNHAWHALRAQMHDAYGQAAAELARVISMHPAVTAMLFPINHFGQISSIAALGLDAGQMPRLKMNIPGYVSEPPQASRQWRAAAFDLVQQIMRAKYPKAAIFQDATRV